MSDPHSFKDINPLWRLSKWVSVEDADALIAGFDPNAVDDNRQYFTNREANWTDSDGISSVHTAQRALENAIMAGNLKATIRRSAWERGWDDEPEKGEAYAQKGRYAMTTRTRHGASPNRDGKLDAAQIGTAWRRANRRTLQKTALGPLATAATDTLMRDDEQPGEAANGLLDAPLDGVSLADALRTKEYWNAKLRQLEYEQRTGQLIELSLAQDVVFELARA